MFECHSVPTGIQGYEVYEKDLDADEEADALRMVTCLADFPLVRTQQVRDKNQLF